LICRRDQELPPAARDFSSFTAQEMHKLTRPKRHKDSALRRQSRLAAPA
jgi:hypothetical protein